MDTNSIAATDHSHRIVFISPILHLGTQEITPTKQRPRLFIVAVTKVLHFLADLLCIVNTHDSDAVEKERREKKW